MGDKIKILYLSLHSEVGGGESSLFYFLKFLDRKRYHPTVLVKEEGTFSKVLKREGIDVEVGDFFYSWSRKWWIHPKRVKKMLCLYKTIKKICPHIIHPNTFEAFLIVSPVSSLLKIPTIATIRGFWEIKDLKDLEYAQKRATIFHLTSRFTLCLYNFPGNKTYIADFGIDIEKFRKGDRKRIREMLQIRNETLLLGVIGRYSPEKGHHIFIEALDLIIKSGKIPNIHALLVGSSEFSMDRNYRWKVEIEVRNRGIEKYFTFWGFREDIPDILHALDILVIPSKYEMCSRIAQEAAAAGVPVIFTDCGGIREVVIDGITGLPFRSGDSKDLKEKLMMLIRNKEMRLKFSQNAKRMAEKFDAKILVKDIEELYKRIEEDET